jgi:hypothetical protein
MRVVPLVLHPCSTCEAKKCNDLKRVPPVPPDSSNRLILGRLGDKAVRVGKDFHMPSIIL